MTKIEQLKQQKIWICWTVVNGSKKPVSASGGPTSADAKKHGATYVTYEEACAARKSLGYPGVGFIIPEGYFFLDIDHRSSGDPLCQMLFERFDSYTEKSQSGEEFHIYGCCDPSRMPEDDSRFYKNNRKLGLELYIGGRTNRFACFTGDRINETDLKDCTQAVLVTLRHEMLKKQVQRKHVPEVHGDSAELFDMICDCRKFKNGDKFTKLYDHGDWSNYSSHSEADCALCTLLAFRIGNDPALIDEAFVNANVKPTKIGAFLAAIIGWFYVSINIKGFFNFEFHWPHIPLPHFSISGSINPLDWFDGGLPSIGIEWYAKAMPKGMILDGPTIFGMQSGRLLGGGESGKEVVVGTQSLMSMINDGIRNAMSLMDPVSREPSVIEFDYSSMERSLKSAMADSKVEVSLVVDRRILARQIVKPMDQELEKLSKGR